LAQGVAQSAAAGKMAKASKAEKAAAKKAEQERLEAERIEQERLDAERLEKERIEAEHQERIRKEKERIRKEQEVERLLAHNETLGTADRDRLFTLAQEYKLDEAGKEWNAYLKCSDLPDVSSEADVNTYKILWAQEADTSLEEALGMCNKGAQICVELRKELNMQSERRPASEAAAAAPLLQTHIRKLREITSKKLDNISAYICQHAEDYADAKNDVRVEQRSEFIDYGIWVNLARHPRTKEVDFEGIGLRVEIPRALALSNIAIRALKFAYDDINDEIARSNYLTLGGPLTLELLNLPPAPKVVTQWTMRQVTALANDVLRLPYPIPPAGSEALTPSSIPPVSEGAPHPAPKVNNTHARARPPTRALRKLCRHKVDRHRALQLP
jgi:cancer susceptibility candidate protein 1